MADEHHLHTPEAILGDGRIELFASPGGATFERRTYQLPERLRTDRDACAHPHGKGSRSGWCLRFPGPRQRPAGGLEMHALSCGATEQSAGSYGVSQCWPALQQGTTRSVASSRSLRTATRKDLRTATRKEQRAGSCTGTSAGVCLAARHIHRSGPGAGSRRRGVTISGS